MSSEVLTDSEGELYTIVHGLTSEVSAHEAEIRQAESNEKLFGALGFLSAGAAYAAGRLPDTASFEKYALAGAAAVLVASAIRENIRWQNNHIKARDKRNCLEGLHQDPDYDSIREMVEADQGELV